MSIKRLVTNSYKNLGSLGIELGNLNILIGPNNSGKSNLVDVLRFLKNSITPSDETIGVSSFDRAVIQLGGANILDKTIDRPAIVNFEFGFEGTRLQLELLVQNDRHKPIVNREILSVTDTDYYRCHDEESGKGTFSVILDDDPQTSFKTVRGVPVDNLALVAIAEFIKNGQLPIKYTPALGLHYDLIETISRWYFYNANHMNLKQILESEPKIGQGDRFLSPQGDNLAIVLHNLMEDRLDFEEIINEAVRTILPTTRRLRTVSVGRLSVTVEWHIENVEQPFYLDEMSDGSVRMLCWATILHSPEPPSLLVIEEPEIGIHTAWLKILSEWIKAASRKTQIIISTHSPDLLDCFTEQVVAETANVLVFSAKGENHFAVERLSREAIADWVQKGWELGDLYRVGDPSIGGWPW
ncbi:MAG: AAA family ATPase [Chloroflexota bacterium]|nr:AAA family ATPase [Chloroflexota bacterium]